MFTMHRPRVHSITQWRNQHLRERSASPGPFIALHAFNTHREILLGYVCIYSIVIFLTDGISWSADLHSIRRKVQVAVHHLGVLRGSAVRPAAAPPRHRAGNPTPIRVPRT